MKLPVETWYDAITIRHSRRKFTGEPVPDTIIERLKKVSESLHPFPGVRSILLRNCPDDIFSGIIGTYGAIENSPHSFVLVGDMSNSHTHEVAGYHGEGLVLEAAASDIDSCWVGGTYKEDSLEEHLNLEMNERILAVIPFGIAIERKSKVERIMSGLIGSYRRKDVRKVLSLGSEEPRGWKLQAIEAARLAPSAVNRQPWRFKIVGNTIEVHTKEGLYKGISPRLDVGIAMLHLELGALKAGVNGAWEFADEMPFVKYSAS